MIVPLATTRPSSISFDKLTSPAFEDYLSALAYQIDTKDKLERLEGKMEELREST